MHLAVLILIAVLTLNDVYADILFTRDGSHTGQVIKVTAAGVVIKVGENEFTIARQDVISVECAKPDAVEKSLLAFRDGKIQSALASLKPITDRYAGLPLPWIEESLMRVGFIQITLKDYAGAKKTFDNFRMLYPQSSLAQSVDIGLARIQFEQGQTDKALTAVQALLGPLLKRDYLIDEQEATVASCLVLQGDCLVAAGRHDDALDSYLKVVALFDADEDQTTTAKYKAGKLFEQRGNWRRAKQSYDELVKDNQNSVIVDDAKKRLADLTKAHPE